MVKKYILSALMLISLPAFAWFDFDEGDYDKCYIASVNGVDTSPVYHPAVGETPAYVTAPEAGTVSGPLTIRVKLTDSSLASQVIEDAKLQYKTGVGTWIDLAPAYAGYTSGGLEFKVTQSAFGNGSLTHSMVAKGASGLIRLYFAGGIYENADLADDPDEGGNAGSWTDYWVVSFTMSQNTRPGKI